MASFLQRKGIKRTYFEKVFVDSLLVIVSGSIMHGTILGLHWDYTGTTMGPPWDYHGTTLGLHWDYHGTTLGLSWDHTGTIMGLYWDYTGYA